MAIVNVIVKFRQYNKFNYLGRITGNIPSKTNKKFPFIGYRKYTKEALPIIEKFSYIEFRFVNELDYAGKLLVSNYYNKSGSDYILKSQYREDLFVQEYIWNQLRTTSYFSVYYSCFPYLLPDYISTSEIEDKYIYIYQKTKGSTFISIYREFYVHDNKYHQGEVEQREEDGGIIYYLDDSREFSNSGTDNISLIVKKGRIEYEYFFILSRVKLSVQRIEALRMEITDQVCNRARQISLIADDTEYNDIRAQYAEKIIEEAAYSKLEFHRNQESIDSRIYTVMNYYAPVVRISTYPEINSYSDLLYNDENDTGASNIIMLTDYIDVASSLKEQFDETVNLYSEFMESEEEPGILKTELKILNDSVSGLTTEYDSDSDDIKEMKRNFKRDHLEMGTHKYAFEEWNDTFMEEVNSLLKNMEIAGAKLAACADTGEFSSLMFDYFTLGTKTLKDDNDEIKIEEIIDFAGELQIALMQSDAGRLFLEKMKRLANAHLWEIDGLDNVDITYIYENYKNDDWWLPIFVVKSFVVPTRKLSNGYNHMLITYYNYMPQIPDVYEIENIIAFQEIRIRKRNIRQRQLDQVNSAYRKAEDFGSNLVSEHGYSRRTTRSGRTITVEIYDVEVVSGSNRFISPEAFDWFCLGLDGINWLMAVHTVVTSENRNLLSSDYMNYLGASFDLTAAIFSKCVSLPLRQVQIINIVSNTFDYFTSGMAAMEAIERDDYDCAAAHGVAAVGYAVAICSGLYIIGACTAAGGIAGGGIFSIPGVLIGFVVGIVAAVIAGIATVIAGWLRDNDYEEWLKHCYWGKHYGEGNYSKSFSEGKFINWNGNIKVQIKAFYNLMYNFSIEHKYNELDSPSGCMLTMIILPKALNDNSLFNMTLKLKCSNNTLELLSDTDLIYIPPVDSYAPSPSEKNCIPVLNITRNAETGIEQVIVKEINVIWSDLEMYRPNSSVHFVENLRTQIEDLKKDTMVWDVKKIETVIKLDVNGDSEYVLSNSWEIDL